MFVKRGCYALLMAKFPYFPKRRKPAAGTSQPDESILEEHPLVVHADTARMDADLREMYRDAREAAAEAREAAADAEVDARRTNLREFSVRSPFQLGFTVTLGVLVALVVGGMVSQLSTLIMWVVAALFIALGLDPVVRWLERRGVRRPLGIAIVFGGFIIIIGTILAAVIPMIANQIAQLVRSAPELVRTLNSEEWYQGLNARFGEFVDFDAILQMGQDFVARPSNLASVAGGVWQAGIGVANGLTAGLIVLILSLYFLASLRSIKRGFYSVVPRSGRAKVIDITEQVTKSVGGYVNGMVILAFTNALLGFIMMTIVGVPFAGLVAVGVFLLALIPLIGSVMATVLVSTIALFDSPITALIAAAYYLIYMQIESYVLTPRIMNRVVSVPGSLVVIGALAGGTLLGLLGALISIPVTATVLMIIKQVWIPRQELN